LLIFYKHNLTLFKELKIPKQRTFISKT